jgi:hypothetical protein
MLADMRHAAHCRALRLAAETVRLADEEARSQPPADEPEAESADTIRLADPDAHTGIH